MYQQNLDQIDNHNLHYHHIYVQKQKKKRLNINYFRNIPFTDPPHAQSRGKFLGLAVRLHVHDFNKPCLQARLTAYVTPAESIAWVKAVSRLATDNKKKKKGMI